MLSSLYSKNKEKLFLKKKYLPVILPSLKASLRLCYYGAAQFPSRKLAEFHFFFIPSNDNYGHSNHEKQGLDFTFSSFSAISRHILNFVCPSSVSRLLSMT